VAFITESVLNYVFAFPKLQYKTALGKIKIKSKGIYWNCCINSTIIRLLKPFAFTSRVILMCTMTPI